MENWERQPLTNSYRACGYDKFGFCSKYKEKFLVKVVLNRTVIVCFTFFKDLSSVVQRSYCGDKAGNRKTNQTVALASCCCITNLRKQCFTGLEVRSLKSMCLQDYHSIWKLQGENLFPCPSRSHLHSLAHGIPSSFHYNPLFPLSHLLLLTLILCLPFIKTLWLYQAVLDNPG